MADNTNDIAEAIDGLELGGGTMRVGNDLKMLPATGEEALEEALVQAVAISLKDMEAPLFYLKYSLKKDELLPCLFYDKLRADTLEVTGTGRYPAEGELDSSTMVGLNMKANLWSLGKHNLSLSGLRDRELKERPLVPEQPATAMEAVAQADIDEEPELTPAEAYQTFLRMTVALDCDSEGKYQAHYDPDGLFAVDADTLEYAREQAAKEGVSAYKYLEDMMRTESYVFFEHELIEHVENMLGIASPLIQEGFRESRVSILDGLKEAGYKGVDIRFDFLLAASDLDEQSVEAGGVKADGIDKIASAAQEASEASSAHGDGSWGMDAEER